MPDYGESACIEINLEVVRMTTSARADTPSDVPPYSIVYALALPLMQQ
jgi:hypothetical protein